MDEQLLSQARKDVDESHIIHMILFVEYCNSCNRGACRASCSVVTLNVYGGAQLVHKFCPSQSHFTNELS